MNDTVEDASRFAHRLARLEAEQQNLTQLLASSRLRARLAVTSLAVVLASVLIMGQGQALRPPVEKLIEAETIVAERVFIADRGGMRRGVFTILPDGRAALLLSEANPQPKAAAGLTVAMDGSSSLVLADREGNTRFDLNLEATGETRIALQDRAERERIGLSLQSDGSPQVDLMDEAANKRVRLAVEADGWSRMQLLDDADRPRVTMMSRASDAAGLFLMDKSIVPRVSLATKESGEPILTLSDEEMRTLWRAP